MHQLLYDRTRVVAYFLWEETKHDNPLTHWYCAEDMSCFLDEAGLFEENAVRHILRKGILDMGYISFMREIAYRIYIYTNVTDSLFNWFAAERLTRNSEWLLALTEMAKIYNKEKDDSDFIKTIRSEKVRRFYNFR